MGSTVRSLAQLSDLYDYVEPGDTLQAVYVNSK